MYRDKASSYSGDNVRYGFECFSKTRKDFIVHRFDLTIASFLNDAELVSRDVGNFRVVEET